MLSRGPDKTMLQGKWGSRKCLENAAPGESGPETLLQASSAPPIDGCRWKTSWRPKMSCPLSLFRPPLNVELKSNLA